MFGSILAMSREDVWLSVVLSLVVAGSLLGDAVAASTVIGVLTIGVLSSINLSPEKILLHYRGGRIHGFHHAPGFP